MNTIAQIVGQNLYEMTTQCVGTWPKLVTKRLNVTDNNPVAPFQLIVIPSVVGVVSVQLG